MSRWMRCKDDRFGHGLYSLAIVPLSQCQSSHLTEQTDFTRVCLVAAELSIDRHDVYDDPLAICPGCVPIHGHISCSLQCWHACLIAFACLLIDVLEIALDLGHSLFVRDRAVTRNDTIDVHRQDAIARP